MNNNNKPRSSHWTQQALDLVLQLTERDLRKEHKPTIIDLFCGCGGFGLGGELAGFQTVAAVDIDSTLQSAYQINFPNTTVIRGDLSHMTLQDWKHHLGNTTVDGIIGGPPCQGYSRMGLGDQNDPRRELLMDFFRHVNLLLPIFFVMENVQGLMDKKNRGQLEKALNSVDKKYTVLKPMLVDASTYGAPTQRKRIIVIGYDPKRMGQLSTHDFLSPQLKTTILDAISDIREPLKKPHRTNDYGWASYRKTTHLSRYAKRLRQPPPKGLGSAQSIQYLAKGMLSGHFNTIHTDQVKKRYASLPQGKTDSISRSKKLAWDGLSPTLRAGTGADRGGYQAVRPLHPEKGRVITVREAARIQGFPDWFTFHPTKWHSFRMIGNSVSPIMSKSILTAIHQKRYHH